MTNKLEELKKKMEEAQIAHAAFDADDIDAFNAALDDTYDACNAAKEAYNNELLTKNK